MKNRTNDSPSANNGDKKFKESFGNRIKKLRLSLNLTQEEFANLLEISNSYISEIETGNKNPKIAFYIKLSQVFKVSLDYIITGTEPEAVIKANHKNKNPLLLEDVIDINDMILLMEHSTLFRNTILSFSAKFFMDNENIIKKNIENIKKEKEQ